MSQADKYGMVKNETSYRVHNKSEIGSLFKKKRDTMALLNRRPHIAMYSKD
jgi:hypothetical protein